MTKNTKDRYEKDGVLVAHQPDSDKNAQKCAKLIMTSLLHVLCFTRLKKRSYMIVILTYHVHMTLYLPCIPPMIR